jgi:hypothetical protein
METSEQLIIPTRSKVKISSLLSYPIGAERLSEALIDVPQFQNLNLHYYFWSDWHLRQGQYEFLRAEYFDNPGRKDWSQTDLWQRPPRYRWEIVVQPVPKIFRHQVKKYIQESALALVRDWFVQRVDLDRKGDDVLKFTYDEKSNEFWHSEVANLEPSHS